MVSPAGKSQVYAAIIGNPALNLALAYHIQIIVWKKHLRLNQHISRSCEMMRSTFRT